MINRIQIENFKSIRKVDVKLTAINILIGANGAGKSNFIGFFKLLENTYDRNLNIYTAEEMGANNVLHYGSKHSDFLAGRVEFDNTNGYEFKLLRDRGDRFYTPDWHEKSIGGAHVESNLKNNESGVATFVRNYIESFKIFHFHDTGKTAKIKQASHINDYSFLREDGSNLASL